MKFSERWLREWIDPPIDTEALAEQLTALGLEVDSIESARPAFENVVVGRIVNARQHPDADRLQVCDVDAGEEELIQVVCGAPNARERLRTAFARTGGRLPDGTRMKKAKLRGVVSFGMLCSAAELGLSEERSGIMELDASATPGADLAESLCLDDMIIDIDLTPDRGDCLSIRGIATDLSARNDLAPGKREDTEAVEAAFADTLDVELDKTAACARFTGRLVRGVDLTRDVPRQIVERLRCSGVRSINAAVDATNHVMLEHGQPMHAFDADKLSGDIHVRLAAPGESLALLDGRTVELDGETTVIADESGAIALAGIMGGASTAVDSDTRNIFLESALFLPDELIGKPRRYACHTDASHRFERGVDPLGQRPALESATRLLLSIAGGEAGVVTEAVIEGRLPSRPAVLLRERRLARVLGIAVDPDEVTRILSRLGIVCERTEAGWQVTPPSARYDLEIEEDYIEEVGRVRGFDSLPRTLPEQRASVRPAPENRLPDMAAKRLLVHRGYQEVVTYSFVDQERQNVLRPDLQPLVLPNPISSELGAMRTTLVGGLIDVYRYNASRQLDSMRLFETGLRFVSGGHDDVIDACHGDDIQLDESLRQQSMLAGLVIGRRQREAWNTSADAVGFFDVKADLEALLSQAAGSPVRFIAARLPMLHPGQSATIVLGEQRVGYLGALDPALQASLDLPGLPFVFEVSMAILRVARVPAATTMSRYPRIRRDLALLVDDAVSHDEVLAAARAAGGKLLQDITLFDLYRGEGLEKGKKSMALGLILQDFSRTLSDRDAERAIARIVAALESETGARLRD